MKKIIAYYFLFLLCTLSLLSSGVIDSQDGFQYLAVARNIYYKGEPTAPEYEYDTRENIHMSTVVGKDGKSYSLTGLGYSLAYLPSVAITDMVYKFYRVSPPVHFPLENDWLILLTASFTNSFFGAMFGVILFLYLLELGLPKKQAIFISLVGLFSTNLLVYAKHSFPHMMFISFLFLSFYLVKRYFKTKKSTFLVLAGASFGTAAITYSQTFVLTIIPLGIYILTLSNFTFKPSEIRSLVRISLFFLAGLLPFILTYFWFENLRATQISNFSSPVIAQAAAASLFRVPVGVCFEGIYGQLFSPGRSFFLYSPLLLIPIFFWHKIKKTPELWIFLSLSLIHIAFFSSIFNPGDPASVPAKGVAALWHGENSWGPRYLSILIPFGMLVVGLIYTKFSKKAKMLVVLPLLIWGVFIQLLGVIIPYQVKLHDLEERFFVNGTEYTSSLYSNLIPRYSPILQMSKNLLKLGQNFPKTFDHGIYNVKFYDGYDFPFSVGGERWRVINKKGYISFKNSSKDPVKKITLGLINHPIEEASYSASVKFSLNGHQLLEKVEVLKPTERRLIALNIPPEYLQSKNVFSIESNFIQFEDSKQYRDNPADYENKNIQPRKYISQILGLIFFYINDKEINKESIDFPYVSSLGPPLTKVNYQNYGGEEKDPWKTWDIHTQMYERLPDFWWIRNLFYWDIPKSPILISLICLVAIMVYTGLRVWKLVRL